MLTDASGHCIEVSANEVGLLIGKMSKTYPFDGYVGSPSITNKKILRNVFRAGDSWFNTGNNYFFLLFFLVVVDMMSNVSYDIHQ